MHNPPFIMMIIVYTNMNSNNCNNINKRAKYRYCNALHRIQTRIGHKPLHFASFYCLRNDPAHQDILAAAIAGGSIKVAIEETFPFTKEGVVALLTKINGGKSLGKNVLKIA